LRRVALHAFDPDARRLCFVFGSEWHLTECRIRLRDGGSPINPDCDCREDSTAAATAFSCWNPHLPLAIQADFL